MWTPRSDSTSANRVLDPSLVAPDAESLSEHIDRGIPWRTETSRIILAYPRTRSRGTSRPPRTEMAVSSTARRVSRTSLFAGRTCGVAPAWHIMPRLGRSDLLGWRSFPPSGFVRPLRVPGDVLDVAVPGLAYRDARAWLPRLAQHSQFDVLGCVVRLPSLVSVPQGLLCPTEVNGLAGSHGPPPAVAGLKLDRGMRDRRVVLLLDQQLCRLSLHVLVQPMSSFHLSTMGKERVVYG